MAKNFSDFLQVDLLTTDFLVGYRNSQETRTTFGSLCSQLQVPLFDSTYSTVHANSAQWSGTSVYALVNSLSDNWNTAYSNLVSNSANWNAAYGVVNAGGTIGGSLYVNGTSTAVTLSCNNLQVEQWSPVAGAAAGNYLNITVAGSGYRVPLYLTS